MSLDSKVLFAVFTSGQLLFSLNVLSTLKWKSQVRQQFINFPFSRKRNESNFGCSLDIWISRF